jgi:hypothetical protein
MLKIKLASYALNVNVRECNLRRDILKQTLKFQLNVLGKIKIKEQKVASLVQALKG